MRPGDLFHHLDDGDRILNFPLQSSEKGYALIFQDSPEAPFRPVDLEKTAYNEKQDDNAADEGEIGGTER